MSQADKNKVEGDEMLEFLGSCLYRPCRRGGGTKARIDESGKTCSQLYDGHSIDETGEKLTVIKKRYFVLFQVKKYQTIDLYCF